MPTDPKHSYTRCVVRCSYESLRAQVGINPARIVCATTINTRMLANACAWEGASTLVNNLLVHPSPNKSYFDVEALRLGGGGE